MVNFIHIYITAAHAVCAFNCLCVFFIIVLMFFRSKDVEWVNFLTTRFVDDITNHLKIYHKAKQRVKKNEGVKIALVYFVTHNNQLLFVVSTA